MFALEDLTGFVDSLKKDIAAARSRDPAARNVGSAQILLSYAGVQALFTHRVSHVLFEVGVPIVPRLLSYASRTATGVEIHPAAKVGSCCFIDHGSGVVIGETAVVGDNATLYQGVTLGGTGLHTGKRHPTLEKNVTVGSGAKLLGPITIGHGSKVGANTVVIHDVPPMTTVVGNPGHPVRVEGKRPEGPDTDWIHLPDPVAEALKKLSDRVAGLEEAIAELTGRKQKPAEVKELRKKKGPSPAGG